jgi:hypothetical protein
LQKYLKANKRDLWLPKEQTKEVERGIWNETYLKRLHETLKVFKSDFICQHLLSRFKSSFSAIPSQEVSEAKASEMSRL